MSSSLQEHILVRLWAGLLACFAGLCLPLRSAADAPPVVDSPAGMLQGETVGKLHLFKGIPFAVAPTGARRWKPPLPLPKWQGTRDATKFGDVCVQPPSRADSI